jgi:DNA primase
MFPIKNSAGLVVGFGARAFSDDVMPKYLNTSETVVYHKSSLLYNFDQAKSEIKRSDMIVVVEGYMDVIASWKTSIRNVVASSGTALTEDHLRLIKRLTNKVSFAFDSDGAGIDASMRAIDMALSADMEVYAIVIPGGKDADECIKTDPSAWEKACEDPLPYLDFIILQVMKKNDIGTAEGRSKVAKDVLTHIKKLSSVIQQDFYIQKLAGELGVSASVLRDEMQILKSDKKFIPKNNSKDIKKPSVLNQEDYIYGILLNYPDLFVILNEVISSDYDVFSREIKNEILELKLKWEKGDLTDAINSSRTGPLALKVSELYVDFTEADYAKEIKRLLGGMKKKDSKNMISYKIDAMKKAEIAGDKDLVLRLKGELQELLKKK